jgi:hypothetical protein
MPTIIEQIQRDALDREVPVSSLLRRVKLAAAKLGLPQVEDWVEHELRGYTGSVPDYRIVAGEPQVRNPYYGWQPIGGHVEHLARRAVGESVAELESLLAESEGDLMMSFPDSVAARINEQNGVRGWSCALSVGRNQFHGIVDRVRSAILDWAIELEKAGIAGSEFSFDADEKNKAQELQMTVNIGSIGTFGGNLGAGNVSGDIHVSNIKVEHVSRLVDQIRAHCEDLVQAGLDRSDLEFRLKELEQQIASREPNPSTLRALLTDLRNTMTGGAGNLIASGVIATVNQILGTGVPAT